uniref:Uncharacterized protein n=1 Tax=Arundo donax TaxID=35708 RepID=A0A0A9GM17_ARUDO
MFKKQMHKRGQIFPTNKKFGHKRKRTEGYKMCII